MRALKTILATQHSTALHRKVARLKALKERRVAIEERLNSAARNREKSGDSCKYAAENAHTLSDALIFEEMRDACDRHKNTITGRDDIIGEWLGVGELRIRDAEWGWATYSDYFKKYADDKIDVLLDNGSITEFLGVFKQTIIEAVDLQAMLRHAYLASRALDMETPETVRNVLEGDPEMFGELKKQLFSDLYAGAILSLKAKHEEGTVETDEIISELLKLLYPNDWKDLLAQTNPISLEKNRERAENRRWKDELKGKYPAAHLTTNDVAELRGGCEGNKERAEFFAGIVEGGLLPSDAIFLLRQKASDSQVAFHASIDACLGLKGLKHSGVFEAVKCLKEKNWDKFASKLNNYANWMRTMPGGMPEAQGQKLSAILAISADAPEKFGEVPRVLTKNFVQILEEINLNGQPGAGLFVAYLIASHDEAERNGERKVWAAPPHEGIDFTAPMNHFIGEDKVSAEDVRLAIAYALKASEGYGKQAGGYVPREAFKETLRKVLPHNYVKNVLPQDKWFIGVRVTDVEAQLRQHGVVVYKRNERLIGLNMDQNGNYRDEKGLSERGVEILRVTKDWMLKMDSGFAGASGMIAQEVPAQPAGNLADSEVEGAKHAPSIFEKALAAIQEYEDALVEKSLPQMSIVQIALRAREALDAGMEAGREELVAQEEGSGKKEGDVA